MISKKTKYGFKALIYLAKKDMQNPSVILDICKSENISQKFLESILLDLKRKGILGSKMGKGGGYYLLQAPDKITLAYIYRMLEGPIAPLPCVSLNYYEKCDDCKNEKKCKLRKMMIKVRDGMLEVLENKTIADFL